VQMPECVPGLLQIVRSEKLYRRSVTLWALTAFRDPRIVQVLREAIENHSADESILSLVNALIICGGVSDAEKVDALETIASETNLRMERYGGQHHLIVDYSKSVRGAIGKTLTDQVYLSDPIAAEVIKRWKQLQTQKPLAAENLWLIALQLDFPSIDI